MTDINVSFGGQTILVSYGENTALARNFATAAQNSSEDAQEAAGQAQAAALNVKEGMAFAASASQTAATGYFYSNAAPSVLTAGANFRYKLLAVSPGDFVRYSTWISGIQANAVQFMDDDENIVGDVIGVGATGNDVAYSGIAIAPAGATQVVVNGRNGKACVLESLASGNLGDSLAFTDGSVEALREWFTPDVTLIPGYYSNSGGTSGGTLVSSSSYAGIRFPVRPGMVVRISGVARATATSLITLFDRDGAYLRSDSATAGTGASVVFTDYEFTVPAFCYELAIISYISAGTASAEVFDMSPSIPSDVQTALAAIKGWEEAAATLDAGNYYNSTGGYATSSLLGNKVFQIPASATHFRCVTTTRGAVCPMAVAFAEDPNFGAGSASFIAPAINVNGTANEVEWTRSNSKTAIPAGAAYIAIVGLSADTIELDFLVPNEMLGEDMSQAKQDIVSLQENGSSRLAGKVVLWSGTSIPAGSGANNYPDKIAAQSGCTMHNQALGQSPYRGGVSSNVDGAIIVGSISGTTLTVDELQTGMIEVGMDVYGPNIGTPTTIIAGSGSSWTVADSQTSASEEIFLGDDPWGLTGLDWERTVKSLTHSAWFKTNELVAKWETKYRDLLSEASAGSKPATLSASDIATIEGAAYENLLLPYIDGTMASADLLVIDWGYNDSAQGGHAAELIAEPTTSAFDRTTAIGALRWLIREVWKANDALRIALNGHYTDQYRPYIVQLQQAMADEYLFPLHALWEKTGWSQITMQTNGYWNEGTGLWVASGGPLQTITRRERFLLDGLHPHKDLSGYATDLIANLVVSWLSEVAGL
ncbi:hypothetical protein [Novosphingobium sp. BW1]|uniref:hypothetical protein n=1 Tax=Novosphingobium sp. BW1 TaxID=2592621 RepID=UPI0011DE9971|nr:hypothetical protein [Novosphingobium sp. BW1]TYC93056.1 hypothetical protein FMM79_03450 [Novosphingobium sp. BW1]